jgi:site-specific DNA-methyltransferase (adenine-specific)
MWEQLKRIIKDNGAICLFGSEPFSSHLRLSNLKMFKYDWIWDKVNPSGFQIAKYVPMKRHEIISVFCDGKTRYFPIKEKRGKQKTSRHYGKSSESSPLKYVSNEARTYSDKNPTSLIRFSNADRTNRFHPTQKPVALLEYFIKTYTLEGETVLDFTMGSGSTGVACNNLNRSFIGIEKDKNYFKISQDRINEV